MIPRSQAAWYNDRIMAFVTLGSFFVGFVQQKSCFTLVAGYCIYRRATDWDGKLFGISHG